MKICITGGGSEIAQAIALRRLKLGDEIIISSSSEETLKKSLGFFEKEGFTVQGFVFSLENPEASKTEFQKIVNLDFDALILNASTKVASLKPFHEIEPSEFKSEIDTNVYGNAWLLRMTLPMMIANKFGRLVFVSSLSAVQGTSRYGGYCLIKSGMEGLFLNLAVDYGQHGISSSIVRPGLIATSRNKKFWSRGHYAEKMQAIIPQGSFGTPTSVAEAIDPLISKNSYMNGSIVTVSGGLPLMNSKGLLTT